MSRAGAVTFKGTPLTLAGQEVKPGQQAPDFTVYYFEGGLKPIKLSDQSAIVGLIIRVLMAGGAMRQNRRIPRRINAWSAAKLVYLKPGVFGQHHIAVRVAAIVFGLDTGILFKGFAVFNGRWKLRERGQWF